MEAFAVVTDVAKEKKKARPSYRPGFETGAS
jgi:hypothetical protein